MLSMEGKNPLKNESSEVSSARFPTNWDQVPLSAKSQTELNARRALDVGNGSTRPTSGFAPQRATSHIGVLVSDWKRLSLDG